MENEIAEKMKEGGKMGFGITRAQLAFKVGRLATVMRVKTPFKNEFLEKTAWLGSKKGIQIFLCVHQHLSIMLGQEC